MKNNSRKYKTYVKIGLKEKYRVKIRFWQVSNVARHKFIQSLVLQILKHFKMSQKMDSVKIWFVTQYINLYMYNFIVF